MSHCPGCNGLVYGGYDDGEHDPCPGCGHEAEIARLRAYIDSQETARKTIEEFSHAKSDEIARLTAERDALKEQVELESGYRRVAMDNLQLALDRASVAERERDALLADLKAVAEAAKNAKSVLSNPQAIYLTRHGAIDMINDALARPGVTAVLKETT